MTRILLLLLGLALPAAAAAQAEPLWLRYPAISPDGATIVFTYRGDLYRVPAAGGAAVQLTTHAAHDFMPVWSRDGQPDGLRQRPLRQLRRVRHAGRGRGGHVA
jgi:tricorn protease